MQPQKQEPEIQLTQPGFTLIELVVVLGVLTILMSLTVPGVLRWQRRMPLDTALSTLQLALQETRLSAIRSGQPWCLSLPHGSDPGVIQPVRGSQDQENRRMFRLPNGIVVEPVSANIEAASGGLPECILFNPDGMSFGRELQLVTRSGEMIRLRIDRLTGRAILSKDPQQRFSCLPDGIRVSGGSRRIHSEVDIAESTFRVRVQSAYQTEVSGNRGGVRC